MLDSNPAINDLKNKIEDGLKNCNNPILILYAKTILNIPLDIVANKFGNGIKNPLIRIDLPKDWEMLRQFYLKAGIYFFVSELKNDVNSYLGSSMNIFRRCFGEHKNKAFTDTSRHLGFYNYVLKNSWSVFSLYILELTPNHVELFVKLNPFYVLNLNEYEILKLLAIYELTIAEQVYLDKIKPNLNKNIYANWSSYNKGSKGFKRSEEANSKLSLSFLNRGYNKSTIDLHRKNRIGKNHSNTTKEKIAENNKGKSVTLVNLTLNKEIQFNSVTELTKELNISARTINRWALDDKVHKTKSLKYPLVKVKF